MSTAKSKPEGAAMKFNRAALEPPFLPWEFPNPHRQRAEKDDNPPMRSAMYGCRHGKAPE